MSLQSIGVWEPGVWAPTVWAEGVWYETGKIPGAGGGRKGRYHYIKIDGRIIFVNSPAEAQRLLRQAKQAKKDVRREQKEEKRRIIKLKKKPEDGDVAWNKEQEKELQALLKQMYDDEEAIVAMLCLH